MIGRVMIMANIQLHSDRMTTITDPRQLPDAPLRMFQVSNEADVQKLAAGRVAYVRRDCLGGVYVYVKESEKE